MIQRLQNKQLQMQTEQHNMKMKNLENTVNQQNMQLAQMGKDFVAMLKANYEELLLRAMEEDKERASIYFKPKLRAI